MRIGIVVDGVAEYSSLTALFDALQGATSNTLVGISKANIQPLAPPPVIAKAAAKSVRALTTKDAGLAVVIFDRETRDECCGRLAVEVEKHLRRECSNVPIKVEVVLKDRTFENWLLSGIADAVSPNGTRLAVPPAVERQLAPNKSDSVDGLTVIKRCINGEYDKVKDARKILERSPVPTMAQNSRSFRKFLAALGHPDYTEQTKQPAKRSTATVDSTRRKAGTPRPRPMP
jgi:hypothetical protein